MYTLPVLLPMMHSVPKTQDRQYLAGCAESSAATSTVARDLPCVRTHLTSEVLEWLSCGGRSA
jgi:hypothetical protein